MLKRKFPITIDLLLLTISAKNITSGHFSQSRRGWERHNEGLMRFDLFLWHCTLSVLRCREMQYAKTKKYIGYNNQGRWDFLPLKTYSKWNFYKKQGVCLSHCALAIFTFKKYLKEKEELWKLKYFTMQKYNLQKNPLKENQNPSRYITTL